jgi:type II secretion system protein H
VPRRGFTLVELLLVLAILVILAATAAPILRGTMQDAALRSAADQIRVEMTRANVRAMKTGRIQVFRFEQGGTQFSVQPYAAADDEIEAAPAVQGFGNAEEEVASARLDKTLAVTLPEGVTFASGEALAEGRAMAIEQDISQSNRFEGDWSQPILFYPDGSSSDAYVIVVNQREVGIRIDLRGMTGAATLGDIMDVKELTDQAELEAK